MFLFYCIFNVRINHHFNHIGVGISYLTHYWGGGLYLKGSTLHVVTTAMKYSFKNHTTAKWACVGRSSVGLGLHQPIEYTLTPLLSATALITIYYAMRNWPKNNNNNIKFLFIEGTGIYNKVQNQ